MSNEWLFFISALIDIFVIFFAARGGIQWLFGTIIINLLLVGIFGAKLLTVFGLTTNAGNVFYACVFLATYFIIERHGKKTALSTIWYGSSFMILFAVMAQFATHFGGSASSDVVNTAISTLFPFSFRIIFASVVAYIFAQYINISIYLWIKKRTNNKYLWLQSNVSNVISQLADSLIFFSIAFFDLSGSLLLQAILAGWCVKSLVIVLGTPFLCIYKVFIRKKI